MNRKKTSVFSVVNYTLLTLVSLTFLYPFLYTIAVSFSGPQAILSGHVFLWPVGSNTGAYQALFKDASMIHALLFTAQLTVFGVLASLAMTVVTAYPLSKKELKGKNILLNLIIFTMYFNGGMIPNYLLIKQLGLLDRIGALFLPGLIDTFLLIIMLNYFRGLPVEIEEAAKVEGANNFRIFRSVVIPLSMPVIATLIIFYAVGYWNSFFDALLYMQSTDKYTLQLKLYIVLNALDSYSTSQVESYSNQIIPENLKAATVLVATVPILIVYPFLQKYFIKGVTIGAIKG
ncbi:carbohydrate ABC transporter permease [Cohnella fermenti]|uniref:Carbohydrate ABC transporter permease n=1 Tax=Cohnella fermenti TaxID=2565925 RepID=A0A4S4BPD8_9BACL|nr:carbohydrate ABC transporter permease [Cohnella fermenti]THF76723.1 carbohydrate ABC transporter permease [Cohnella fermenti]